MLATDFFHVDCPLALERLYCLFVGGTGGSSGTTGGGVGGGDAGGDG
jgi:hypothetical protein